MSTGPEPQPTPLLGPLPVPDVPQAALPRTPPTMPLPFRDPDRLDGYTPVRSRPARQTEVPYLAEDFAWSEPPLTQAVRELRLKRMVDSTEEFEPEGNEDTEEEDLLCAIPADVFLTGKAVRSEIKLKDLTHEQRQEYIQSMGKEWSSWEKFNAVEVLTPEQILNLPKDVKIIGTRWVHTDKNQKQRLLALHLRAKTGKSEEQIRREYPLSAKSIGSLYRGTRRTQRTSAPTAPRPPSLLSTWSARRL